MMREKRALAVALCAAAAATTLADVVQIQSVKDNTLFEDAETQLSNGAGEFMFSGQTIAFGSRRALLQFDIASAVPAGSTIDSVTMRLHCSAATSGTRSFEVHRVLQEWGEGTSDAGDPGGGGIAAEAGDATWTHAVYPSTFWTSPGGDFVPTSSAVTGVGSIGWYDWSSAGMSGDVQGWLNAPLTNQGWLLRGDESTSRTARRFDTRENSIAEQRPVLIIAFTPIPEPATVALLAVGLVTIARSRLCSRSVAK